MGALFLDRDGVVNIKLDDDYVKQWSEFVFKPGFLKYISLLNHLFSPIVIVTNQRGIGRGLMTDTQLSTIHQLMLAAIQRHSGHIDHIYYCSANDNDHPCRKPNIGMGLMAKYDWPDVQFRDSLLIGDSLSDIQFASQLGMPSIYLNETPRHLSSFENVYYASDWDACYTYIHTTLKI